MAVQNESAAPVWRCQTQKRSAIRQSVAQLERAAESCSGLQESRAHSN